MLSVLFGLSMRREERAAGESAPVVRTAALLRLVYSARAVARPLEIQHLNHMFLTFSRLADDRAA